MADESNGRFKLTQTTAVQVVTWLIAGLLTFAAVNARVSVLESRVNGLERQLERIEAKLDRLLVRP